MKGTSIMGSLSGDDISALERICEKYGAEKGSTIPILQDVQEHFGYLPEDAVYWMADRLDIPRSSFYGVATFYSQFYLNPRGKNIVTVCCGTACHIKGSDKILNGLRAELKLADGVDTTPDMKFTLERVNCVGACSIAPVVIVNKQVNGKATGEKIIKKVRDITKH